MAVAGILSQKTKRPIKALYGGAEAYWAESELKSVTTPKSITAPSTGGSPQAPRAPEGTVPAAPAPAAPQRPKKKSAGC